MASKTMKAVQLHEFGGPEVLRYEDVLIPDLKPDEVLIRVHAVGINPPDWYLRDGFKIVPVEWRPPVPLPAIPGTDRGRYHVPEWPVILLQHRIRRRDQFMVAVCQRDIRKDRIIQTLRLPRYHRGPQASCSR